MASRQRRGMLVKNTNVKPVTVDMESRSFVLKPGEVTTITADEVRDRRLREMLQVRAISIVRPATEDEEEELRKELFGEES